MVLKPTRCTRGKKIWSSSQGFDTHIYICVHLHVLD